jgi:hypothetical protein
MRMLKCGHQPPLALEPRLGSRIFPVSSRDRLQRHLPTQLRIASAVHVTHTSAADMGDDFIAP